MLNSNLNFRYVTLALALWAIRQTGATGVEQNEKPHSQMMFHSQIIWQDALGSRFVRTPAVVINGHTYATLIFQVEIPPKDILDSFPDLIIHCAEDKRECEHNTMYLSMKEIIKEVNITKQKLNDKIQALYTYMTPLM